MYINDMAEIVRLLIASGCDVDMRSEKNRTALHMAVWSRRPEIVKILLRTDCDTDVHDRYGDTPLMLCALRGYVEIMRVSRMVLEDTKINSTLIYYMTNVGLRLFFYCHD